MDLLLTTLSVLALWALLGVLIFGLLLILKTLESVRRSMQQITMGVRAIEHQTLPLGVHADSLTQTLGESATALEKTAENLASITLAVDALTPRLAGDLPQRCFK
jgi:uncharacterized protein YoxC